MPIVIMMSSGPVKRTQARWLLKNKIKTVQGDLFMKRFVREPSGHITMEDFALGVTISWNFWHEEVHYIVKG
jgi:hypothetical protein